MLNDNRPSFVFGVGQISQILVTRLISMFYIPVCKPLFSAVSVVWLDLRTQSTVERLINKTPGRNKNHLKVRDDGKEIPSFVCLFFF